MTPKDLSPKDAAQALLRQHLEYSDSSNEYIFAIECAKISVYLLLNAIHDIDDVNAKKTYKYYWDVVTELNNLKTEYPV